MSLLISQWEGEIIIGSQNTCHSAFALFRVLEEGLKSRQCYYGLSSHAAGVADYVWLYRLVVFVMHCFVL